MLFEDVDLKSYTSDLLSKSGYSLDYLAENVFNEMVEEIAIGICFDIHRSVKTGLFSLVEIDNDKTENNALNGSGVDVFGSVITTNVGVPTLKKQPGCICPNCARNLAASRFAPHLEKCMGMGRNSSRLASRRLATNNNKNGSNSSNSANSGTAGNTGTAHEDEDDAEDEDWIEPGKTLNRRKRDKNSPRRNRGPKCNRNNYEYSADGSITPPNYDQLSVEERSNLLSNICGVHLSTSRKICTRSTKCPMHTDGQRREVRIRWLGPAANEEEPHVDIDSFTEGDTVALRESLSLLSSASSPAESTISTSSNPSNSRGSSSGRSSKNRRGKRGKGGSKNGSRGSTPPLME